MPTLASEMEREIQNDNKIAADWLLWVSERRLAYNTKRLEILTSSGPCLNDLIPGNKIITSDPTGRKGQLLGDLKKVGEWLNLIDDIETKLSWKLKIFLFLRREHRFATGRNGWVASVQIRFADELAKKLCKKSEETWIENRRTFFNWWNQIVNITVRQACKRGLL